MRTVLISVWYEKTSIKLSPKSTFEGYEKDEMNYHLQYSKMI